MIKSATLAVQPCMGACACRDRLSGSAAQGSRIHLHSNEPWLDGHRPVSPLKPHRLLVKSRGSAFGCSCPKCRVASLVMLPLKALTTPFETALTALSLRFVAVVPAVQHETNLTSSVSQRQPPQCMGDCGV